MKSAIAGAVLSFAGFICVVVGFVVHSALSSGAASMQGSLGGAAGAEVGMAMALPSMILWGVGGLLLLLGVPLFGLGLMQSAARRNEMQQIMTSGVEGQAAITFLDRNWSVRINGQPIYSIVEYRFQDSSGREFVRRVDDIKSEIAIRSGWQVGSQIRIRYLAQDPSKSGIMVGM